jgi:HEAT repeat protein
MKPTRALLLLALLLPDFAAAQSPRQRLAALAGGDWLSYEVELQPGAEAPCCFTWEKHRVGDAVCRLDQRGWNFGTRGDDPPAPADARLRVLLRKADDGSVDRVRALGTHCAVDPGDARVVEAGAASAQDSLALLQPVASDGRHKEREHALAAIAHHAGAGADRTLVEAAAPGHPRAVRREALFWLAAARGEPGFRAVQTALQNEGDDELRRHLVFALSISKAAPAAAELRRAATTHADGQVRGEAMFWMAQNKDPQSEAVIRRALREETSREVLDKAVFALSQLPAERSIPALRELIEKGATRHVRKQALFWLAQVDDEAVLPVFDELLGGRTTRR